MCQLQNTPKNAIKSMSYWNMSGSELPLQASEVHFFQAVQTKAEQKSK
jgi:hypothetical protein